MFYLCTGTHTRTALKCGWSSTWRLYYISIYMYRYTHTRARTLRWMFERLNRLLIPMIHVGVQQRVGRQAQHHHSGGGRRQSANEGGGFSFVLSSSLHSCIVAKPSRQLSAFQIATRGKGVLTTARIRPRVPGCPPGPPSPRVCARSRGTRRLVPCVPRGRSTPSSPPKPYLGSRAHPTASNLPRRRRRTRRRTTTSIYHRWSTGCSM